MLHGLHALKFRKLTVVHLDHRLRGRSSTADAAFVARLAAKLGYPCIPARANVREYAGERGVSLETAARELRHVFFEMCARKTRCRTILLAHHAEDQVETCLFNFLRGAGAAGIAGMRAVSQLRIGNTPLTLVRPMLRIRRFEIDGFMKGRAFREDATNEDLYPTRNRLRHRVIPAIREAMGAQASDAILRNAEILRAEDEWMEVQVGEPPAELSVKELRSLALALQRRVVRRWLIDRGVEDMSFELVSRVLELVPEGARVAKINLPLGWHVRRSKGRLFVERG